MADRQPVNIGTLSIRMGGYGETRDDADAVRLTSDRLHVVWEPVVPAVAPMPDSAIGYCGAC